MEEIIKNPLNLNELPSIKIWADAPIDLSQTTYKGKFVMTNEGRFFAKLFPLPTWDQIDFYHDMILKELGIQDPTSEAIKSKMAGGGKIEVALISEHVECRLYGKSTNYGHYNKKEIDPSTMEKTLRTVLTLDELPILVTVEDSK